MLGFRGEFEDRPRDPVKALAAARQYMILMGVFEEGGLLNDWVTKNNPKYESNTGDRGTGCIFGLLEEHLNYVNHINLPDSEPENLQLDLLYPIKEKSLVYHI